MYENRNTIINVRGAKRVRAIHIGIKHVR